MQLGIHLYWTFLQNVSNAPKIWTSISGFIFSFIMSVTYFGHFRHQGVKISKFHKPIFCSKLTLTRWKNLKFLVLNFVSTKIWQVIAYTRQSKLIKRRKAEQFRNNRPEPTKLPFNHSIFSMILRRKWNTNLLKSNQSTGWCYFTEKNCFQKIILNFFLKIYIYFEKNNNQLTDYPQSFLRGAPKSCAHLACSFSSLALCKERLGRAISRATYSRHMRNIRLEMSGNVV